MHGAACDPSQCHNLVPHEESVQSSACHLQFIPLVMVKHISDRPAVKDCGAGSLWSYLWPPPTHASVFPWLVRGGSAEVRSCLVPMLLSLQIGSEGPANLSH